MLSLRVGGDSDVLSPGRDAVRSTYRAMTPRYPLADSAGAIYQAFTVGRVRVIMTDSRSERTPDDLLGPAQLRWFLDELIESSRTHRAVLWASPTPWVGSDNRGIDTWPGFPELRRQISDAIAQAQITNLVMTTGDIHMAALDDASNPDHSTDGWPGFPVWLASPLDQVPGNRARRDVLGEPDPICRSVELLAVPVERRRVDPQNHRTTASFADLGCGGDICAQVHMGSASRNQPLRHDRVDELLDRAMPKHIGRYERLEVEVNIDGMTLCGPNPAIDQLEPLLVAGFNDIDDLCGRHVQFADRA